MQQIGTRFPFTVADALRGLWRNTTAVENSHSSKQLPQKCKQRRLLTATEYDQPPITVSARLAFLLTFWRSRGITTIWPFDFDFSVFRFPVDTWKYMDDVPQLNIAEQSRSPEIDAQPRYELLLARARAYDAKQSGDSGRHFVVAVARCCLKAWQIMGRAFFWETRLAQLASAAREPLPEC
ncbi:unnamed protein product [Polarella glacialis]|uniref:Uncharacterized protein n=1 Tax=Polarella glacialis TaxID=89957 RepID=A0A813HTX6_POLGL|nr:unnamed protein product [Polarella glacialis]CAE8640841.1 unnamed protein product [Polarella glacialis]